MNDHGDQTLVPRLLTRAASAPDVMSMLVDRLVATLREQDGGSANQLAGHCEDGRRSLEGALEVALHTTGCALTQGKTVGEPTRSIGETSSVGEVSRSEQLFDALVREPMPSAEELAQLPAGTAWRTLPSTVLPVALVSVISVARRMPADILWRTRQNGSRTLQCGLVPDPSSRTQTAVQRLLHGHTAAVGPVSGIEQAGAAMRWTRALLSLVPDSPALGGGVACVEDHLASLLLVQDTALSAFLASRSLAPLRAMDRGRRRRLSVTILAWLREGSVRKAAQALGVHPQTIRYRLRQAEKVFGNSLYEPRARLHLTLALMHQALHAEGLPIDAADIPAGLPLAKK